MFVRQPGEVPQPSRVSRAVREQQELYEGFIKQVPNDNDVGELDPGTGEQIRALKVRLRRASSRLGIQIETWDANGKVYFAVRAQARRRGRPRKAA